MTDAPRDLRACGRRLWHGLTEVYDFDPAEEQLLVELARTADTLEHLAVALRRKPLDPALMAEARQQRITYARLHGALRLPDPGDQAKRAQRRTGVRRPYTKPLRMAVIGGGHANSSSA